MCNRQERNSPEKMAPIHLCNKKFADSDFNI